MDKIPSFLIEYVLFGRDGSERIERFTQDAGIGIDVWNAFAKDLGATAQVILTPAQRVTGVRLASSLHKSIQRFAKARPARAQKVRANVSPMESFVSARIGLFELIQVVLPLTAWWSRMQLSSLRDPASTLRANLRDAIVARFSSVSEFEPIVRRAMRDGSTSIKSRLIESAPTVALIGVFDLRRDLKASEFPDHPEHLPEFFLANAEDIADRGLDLLAGQMVDELEQFRAMEGAQFEFGSKPPGSPPPPLVQRVFTDRAANIAESEGIGTIKADAAARLFDVDCTSVTWAVIDAGIAAKHPAFLDHGAKDPLGKPIFPPPSRVRATYDFTRLEVIRSYDLTLSPPQSEGRAADIERAIDQLVETPGRDDTPAFREVARRNLERIAQQLDSESAPDWALIEPLIKLEATGGDELSSDHGTHVAGVLGADWREPDSSEIILQGVCPDINLLDMRVIGGTEGGTESAVIGALEFIRFLNEKAAAQEIAVAGCNISLSIPYDPKKYGCGVTPVCTASDRLSNSGVVVVVAAGNRGWIQQPAGFSAFSFCSITDPGNAHDVITVGSTHRLKPHLHGISYFSSRGPTGDGRIKPDLVAPGEKIRGPVRGDTDDELDGTSFAAPFVSGGAAMLISRHKELLGDPSRVKQILCSTATDLGREKYFQGAGLVDVLRALQSV
ncbi:S8 family serine peptidase [Roseateles asaccharophilus]|uniref:Subtilisin family serine protease n=1 Tax=Roseateles asaccharophilus TaxID=582607 RepID=A0ABU2ABC8_9BURK|nr:S8 family serine peptidase [Roseateles asaccharophilus]MDR7334310.1 subtilisin family serine protease [Roseateles asaccharophilus]